jgi:hypothetical protein
VLIVAGACAVVATARRCIAFAHAQHHKYLKKKKELRMSKHRKNLSDRKLKANRQNAGKSTGPKTPEGKRYSKRNAIKHGLFSTTMIINEKDRPKFDALRMEIIQERAPETVLQFIACEEIVNCTWRVLNNSTLLEQNQLKLLLLEKQEVETSAEKAAPPAWYGGDRTDLHNYESVLSRLYQDAKSNAGIHIEKYEGLLAPFSGGTHFFKLLTDWAPQNPDAILIAEHLTLHAKTFKVPLPQELVQPDEDTVANLSRMSWEMILKLIEQEMQHVRDWRHAIAQGWASDSPVQQHMARFDTVCRYSSATRRDLDRAIERYLRVKEAGL